MEIDKPRTSVKLSRAELYDEVWKMPLMRLAPRYGITDKGLAKICSRLNVPYPPSGYWLKVNAGKSPAKVALPPAQGGTRDYVIITPTPEPSSEELEAESAFAKALEHFKAIEVCKTLRGQHPAVAELIADHDRRFAEAKREQRMWGGSSPRVGPLTEVDHRIHRFLSTFLKEAGKVGFNHVTAAYVQSGKIQIEFSLEQYWPQFRRTLEPHERSPFRPNQKWTQEISTTSQLRFRFLTKLWRGAPSVWIDDPDSPLEGRIGEILATLVAAIPFLERKRIAEEGKERVRIETERRRQQEEIRRKIEKNRWRRFSELSERWHAASRIRSFIAQLEVKSSLADDPLAGGLSRDEWLAWVKQRLSVHDPLEAGVDAIWSNLSGVTSLDYSD